MPLELHFLNKCDDLEKKIISEYYQRCFGEDLPESSIKYHSINVENKKDKIEDFKTAISSTVRSISNLIKLRFLLEIKLQTLIKIQLNSLI